MICCFLCQLCTQIPLKLPFPQNTHSHRYTWPVFPYLQLWLHKDLFHHLSFSQHLLWNSPSKWLSLWWFDLWRWHEWNIFPDACQSGGKHQMNLHNRGKGMKTSSNTCVPREVASDTLYSVGIQGTRLYHTYIYTYVWIMVAVPYGYHAFNLNFRSIYVHVHVHVHVCVKTYNPLWV